MVTGSETLSEIIHFSKYAKYIPSENRRETRTETFDRNKAMHLEKFPQLTEEIENAYKYVYDGKILPSMRSLQFGGKSMKKKNPRGFNCSYGPVDHPWLFSEAMYLLLCGCGLGYSVRKMHVEKLPDLRSPGEEYVHTVEDSIEGWADAVKAVCNAYFYGTPKPCFDYTRVSVSGTRLNSGIIAPGPDKLKECLDAITGVFEKAYTVWSSGPQQLTPLQAHDILCYIACAVVAGGIRRSACIALFDWDDEEMLNCKIGDWWAENPQRGRANNSVVLNRTWEPEYLQTAYKYVSDIAKKALLTGSGDPGILFTNDDNYGANPCVEISLNYNFCCLVEIVGRYVTTQEEFEKLAKAAAFIATLQASYTDFKYLRRIWQERTEEEALIGVSITGIVEGEVLDLDSYKAAQCTVAENVRVAKLIGINPSHRCTAVKPAGTTTLFSASKGSGCHDVFSRTDYIRRMRVGKNEPIYYWAKQNVPELLEDEAFNPEVTAVLSIPIKVENPEQYKWAATPLEFLERVKHLYDNWIIGGHVQGPCTNNVSATCYVTPEDHEEVFQWLWDNREHYMGMSVLPKDNANYPQMPLEAISKERYDELAAYVKPFDTLTIFEPEDITDFGGEVACSGAGGCEVTSFTKS